MLEKSIHSLVLLVLFLPVFRKAWGAQPSSQIVSAGSSFVLECQPPVGRPEPEITWEKDGQPLDVDSLEGLMMMDDGSLVISSATAEDAGSYVCIGSNPAKVRTSKAAVITVT